MAELISKAEKESLKLSSDKFEELKTYLGKPLKLRLANPFGEETIESILVGVFRDAVVLTNKETGFYDPRRGYVAFFGRKDHFPIRTITCEGEPVYHNEKALYEKSEKE